RCGRHVSRAPCPRISTARMASPSSRRRPRACDRSAACTCMDSATRTTGSIPRTPGPSPRGSWRRSRAWPRALAATSGGGARASARRPRQGPRRLAGGAGPRSRCAHRGGARELAVLRAPLRPRDRGRRGADPRRASLPCLARLAHAADEGGEGARDHRRAVFRHRPRAARRRPRRRSRGGARRLRGCAARGARLHRALRRRRGAPRRGPPAALMLELLWIPFLACLVLTAIHVYLGLHVLARGVIFVDLALAQVAGLGVTVAFLA